MPPLATRQAAPRDGRPVASKGRTVEFRSFIKGLNLTDDRTAIGDDELSWCENALPIGRGAVQILRGPGASIATIATGIASLRGFTLNAVPVVITINRDGSITQVTVPGGVTTTVAGAAMVTSACVMSMWRGTTILFLDANGYFSWDGSTFTTISTTQTGNALAVFQGRAWLINGRTITYTAPNTFNDFTAGNGAGSTVLTDEAFDGNIVEATSATEQLWLLGQSSVETISNVTASGSAPSVVTTFSVTNIVTNIGTAAHRSVLGFFRVLTFLAPFGEYALSGVVPQRLSKQLDGLFPDLTITSAEVSAAVAVVENLPCLVIRVRYTGQKMQNGAGPIAMLLIFTEGRWTCAYQGAVTQITTVVVNGVSQAWGTTGTDLFQLFGAAASTAVTYKIQGKLHNYGDGTKVKGLTKAGLEFRASAAISPTFTVDTLYKSRNQTVTTSGTLTLTVPGGTLSLTVPGGALTLTTQGAIRSTTGATMYGSYLGWTITGTDPPYLLQGVAMEVEPIPGWEARQI